MTLINFNLILVHVQYTLTCTSLNYFILVLTSFKGSLLPYITYILLILNQLQLIPGLVNSISIIHPVIVLLVFNLIRGFKGGNFIVCVLWLSLFLGGWWASQEFNWGGWWNWDFIETPILLCGFLVLYYNHKLYKYNSIFLKLKFVYNVTILVIFLIINTRFLDNSSIHSFTDLNFFKEYKLLLLTNSLFIVYGFLTILDNLIVVNYFMLYTLLCFSNFNNYSKFVKLHQSIYVSVLNYFLWFSSGLSGIAVSSYNINVSNYNHIYYIIKTSLLINWLKEVFFKF